MPAISATPPAALLDTRHQVETPEGIDLILRPAGLLPRALAFGIDLLIKGVLGALTALVQGYQEILLRGAWPPLSTWLVISGWLVLAMVLLSVLVSRSRDQLVDWL